MKIPFAGPSYQSRSLNASAQRSVNCYLELDDGNPRAPVAMYGTPGLTLIGTLGSGPIRGAIAFQDYACAVSGNEVYAVEYTGGAYVTTLVGTIGTSTGPVGLAYDGVQGLIVDGVSGWLVTLTTLTQITDADFPNGVTQATSQDGYFIVTGDGTGQFYINETPRNGAGWSGLDFASAEGSPDNTVTCISDHRELWLGGRESFEIWVNTGNPDFPFERSGNAFIQIGTASASTVRSMDNTIFWLGQDRDGNGMVYKAQGYSPVRISTSAVELALQGYSTLSDAFAFTYQQEGHAFYVLTFPTDGKTWVFDASTGFWHERAWRNPSTGVLGRWRPSCHVFLGGKHLVGDYENGKFYELDLDVYTDNGDPILRLRSTQCMDSANGERLFYASMQVDMETGVGLATGQGSAPLLMMRYSDDGGHAWSNERTVSIGAVGEYGARALFRRLGNGRNRVWEISLSDPVRFAVIGAYSKFTKGSS